MTQPRNYQQNSSRELQKHSKAQIQPILKIDLQNQLNFNQKPSPSSLNKNHPLFSRESDEYESNSIDGGFKVPLPPLKKQIRKVS